MASLRLNLAIITIHDYLFFASQDYGSSARPAQTVGNYALMYAINREIPEVRRVFSAHTPFYDVDLPLMKVYATPAASISSFQHVRSTETAKPSQWVGRQSVVGERNLGRWETEGIVGMTWNSIGESVLATMKRENINIPRTGVYYKISPLNSFYCYTVGEPIPSVFRLGKKFAPVRVRLFGLNAVLKEGLFEPTCPVNVADLPEDTKMLRGSIATVPPSPLLLDSELEGKYLEAKDEKGSVHRIPQADPVRYTSSWGSFGGNG